MDSDMINKTRKELIETIDQLNKKLDARDSKSSRDIEDKDGKHHPTGQNIWMFDGNNHSIVRIGFRN